MSNTVRNKFAGLIRGLLRRNDPEKTDAEASQRPVSSTAPSGGSVSPAAGVGEAPEGATDAEVRPSVPAGENEIALPLAPVIAGLPLDLRAKIMAVPPAGMTINLPIETVVTQLAFGAVKISFGELRQLTNGVFVNSGGELDSKLVALPLNEILSRINPNLLGRRSGNKVEVSDDIAGPFNGRCNGVVFTVQPLKAPKAEPKPDPAEPAASPYARKEDPLPSAPIAFRPPAGLSAAPKPPINGANGANGLHGVNGANGSQKANGNGHRLSALPSHTLPVPPKAPTPKISAAPAPVPPTPAPSPTPPRPELAQPTIYASLSDLCENWPEELRAEISRSNLFSVSVPLAGKVVDAGLKAGRLTMTWKDLRILAKPSSARSPNDGLELELPLKVIAPLFFAAQKTRPQARKATSVSSEIPNLFFGFPQAAPEVSPSPRPAAGSPASSPKTNYIPKPVEKKNGETNFFVWGDEGETPRLEECDYAPPPVPQTDFTNRRAMPKDLVLLATKLPGVAGAVVALPDGLRVASEVVP